MIEGLPWPVWGGLFASGWGLAALLLLNFANGKWFVSRREAQSYLDRATHSEALSKDLTQAVAGMTAVGQLQKAMIEARERATGADGGDTS